MTQRKSIIEQWKAIEIAAQKYKESLDQLHKIIAIAKTHGMTDQQIKDILQSVANPSQTKN